MNRTQIYLPKIQIEFLRRLAQKQKTSVSEIIRSSIREKLEKGISTVPIKKEGLLCAARRINRMGKKGPEDLAINLDKYLYGRK
ncbi:MAG: hypothetical protein COT33_01800 [Candidatus Nealsonbacteria bacterium CG08_land_8_20_14_0_20_38_20]|uniref:Ribbon-helix-helix protein CopG domain-containing protein n=1 Tax=Candidatus Nealsonbacteria bacterium CG08_land_8_20_14_0_20_38_20 TaxID=1974705 RepID=A0A2H0YMI1_9BACT|nr:MAG: hypothetical protein COT33_01800 [Candidatus Nealsonbacteria bacterium CG08_land_8_20_14_0_20_38_20]